SGAVRPILPVPRLRVCLGLGDVVVGADHVLGQLAEGVAIVSAQLPVGKAMRGVVPAALAGALEEQEVVGPTLVPLLRHRIVRLHAGPAGSVDDGLPSGHRPYLLAGDELHTLLPAVPEGAELSILLLFDEELHDRAAFVLAEFAGVRSLPQVVFLQG